MIIITTTRERAEALRAHLLREWSTPAVREFLADCERATTTRAFGITSVAYGPALDDVDASPELAARR